MHGGVGAGAGRAAPKHADRVGAAPKIGVVPFLGEVVEPFHGGLQVLGELGGELEASGMGTKTRQALRDQRHQLLPGVPGDEKADIVLGVGDGYSHEV